jgi:hypothetical protein
MTKLLFRFGRLLTRWTVIAVVVVALSAVSSARQRGRGAPARTIDAGALTEARRTIDKAAVARGLVLTDAAKEALAKESVREQATDPAADRSAVTGKLSEEKVTKLLAPLESGAATQLTDQDVRTRVANEKLKQIETTLPSDVATHVANRPGLPEEVQKRMVDDLVKQSDALSKSGLTVDAIRVRNEATLRVLDQALGTAPVTPQTYQQAMLAIFEKQVDVTITTTPAGASVSANGASIGNSNIAAKPFKPGSYVFAFRLAGFRPAEREFYVSPGDESESLDEPLAAEPSAQGAGGPSSDAPSKGGPVVPNDPGGSFPWTYAVLIAIIVVLAGALVIRRR